MNSIVSDEQNEPNTSDMDENTSGSNNSEILQDNNVTFDNEFCGDVEVLQYALFCGVILNDIEIVHSILNTTDNNKIIRADFQTICEIDKCMSQQYFSKGTKSLEKFSHNSDIVFLISVIVESCNFPVLFVCCLKNQASILDFILSCVNIEFIETNVLKELLHYSCTFCSVQCVKVLFSHKVEPSSEELITSVACYQPGSETAEDYLSIAKLLLENGCNPNDPDESNYRAIHLAAAKSDSRMTKLLIDFKANVTFCVTDDHTPLMIAIKNQSQANIIVLLNCESTLDSCSCSISASPLGIAVEFGNIPILLKLLQSKAIPLGFKTEELSPLVVAANNESLVILWLLLCFGGDVNTRNLFNNDCLLLTLTRKNNINGVKLLLRYGANIDTENKLGCTPLWAAVSKNHKELVQLLLYVNCSMDAICMEYMLYCPVTVTMLSLYKGERELLELLLEAGGSVISSKIHNPDILLDRTYHKDPEIKRYILEWTEKTKSLKWMCRNVIRKSTGQRIDLKIKQIDYPFALKRYILLDDILFVGQKKPYLPLVGCNLK